MCRMSARWNLCKCCCGGQEDDRAPHFYCGCEASNNVKRSKLKMYGEDLSTEDLDKQNLIFDGNESDNNTTEKREKDEWVVHNPSVAFESEFGDALDTDRSIRIFGTVLPDAFSFTINICRIIAKQLDIGLHFNPRFDQQYIARNSKLDGKWGIEEAQSYCRFPFTRGEKFCLEIFTTHNEFMIAVNGLHYCAFSYRYPLFDLNRIEIFGSVSLQKIVCVSSKLYPSELSTSLLPKAHFLSVSNSGTKSHNSDPLDCVTPLVISLEDKISAGTEIEISGRVKLLPHSFYVNLQRGKLNCPHPVINLHVNARFREKPNRGCCTILSNSWIADEWGSEQFASRDSYFFAGQTFKLKIKCQDEAFLLSNNDNTIMSFTHRSDFSRVNTILVVGDIFVHSITLQ